MARHYSDNGRLVAIECEDCGALIAPNPHISESGWMKYGKYEYGTRFEWDYCPKHAIKVP